MIYLTQQTEAELALLNAKLKSLAMKDARNMARAGVRAGARVLMKEAKSRAPVGRDYRRTSYTHQGGTLRKKGFTLGRGRFGDKHTVSWLVKMARRSRLGIPANEPGYYPAIVEYGVKKGPRQFAGRKYLKTALDAKAHEATRKAIDAAWAYLEKQMAKKVTG